MFSGVFLLNLHVAQYSNNRCLIGSSYNLSVYESRDSCLLETLTKDYVFKESNFSINKYYWSVKTNDGCFYYTSHHAEEKTLGNILRTTRISELRSKLVDDYFAYILVSYACKENEQDLGTLSSGEPCTIGNVTVRTQDWFQVERIKSLSQRTEVDDCDEKIKTPDLVLSCLGKEVVIDAYNGANEKEIKRKLQEYANHFKDAKIYVFASGLSKLEQMVSRSEFEFAFYELVEGDLVFVPVIMLSDDLTLKIEEINDRYKVQYCIFKSENFYWQQCEAHKKILQRLPVNMLK